MQSLGLGLNPVDGVLRKEIKDYLFGYMIGRAGEFRTHGVHDFMIVCDETNNPPWVVNNGQLAATVKLRRADGQYTMIPLIYPE
jgi:hypothetical protein